MPCHCQREVMPSRGSSAVFFHDPDRVLKIVGSRIPVLAAVLLCVCAGALAQSASALKEGTVYSRPVYFVANDKLEVAVVKQGGSMLRILIQGDSQ